MCSYPIPNILLPHDVEAQLRKRSSKGRSQLDLLQMGSQEKELTEGGDIAQGGNSSTEELCRVMQ
jgi:hypothetical protein